MVHIIFLIMVRVGKSLLLVITVLVIVLVWFALGVVVSMSTEYMDYRVVEKSGDVEIREYGELDVITTTAATSNSAFSTLSSFIFGDNSEGVRFAMTAPVMFFKDGGGVRMSFVLPQDHGPVPQKENILIETVPARSVAVIRYSGYVNEGNIEEHRLKLEKALEDKETKGDYFVMRYDPPWVPPLMMRNEVAIEVVR